VELFRLDSFSFPVQWLVLAAQDLANVRGHEVTSAAHVNHVLFQMKPVRDAIGTQVTESAIDTALMVEKKSSGRMAQLTQGIAMALGDDKSTVGFLRRYALGHPVAAKPGLVFAAHADAIAAALDAPLWTQLVTKPVDHADVCPILAGAVMQTAERRHGEITTRHVLLALLKGMQEMLTEKAITDVTLPVAEIEALVERSARKSDTKGPPPTILMSPKLAGVLASLIIEGGDALKLKLHLACAQGDDAVAPAMEKLRAAQARLREAKTQT
jgi:hypothetical protein